MIITPSYVQLRRQVLQAFQHAPDRDCVVRQNPFTGSSFVPSMGDDLDEQVEAAVPALGGAIWFHHQAPSGIQVPVPCTWRDASRMKASGSLGYIAGCFWQSLQCGGFDISAHPDFPTYARAVMALDPLPVPLRHDLMLAATYQPQKLSGLKSSNLVWSPVP
ncbi:hypothetical protein DHODJN_25270 [Methylorubrum extorquens]